MKVDEFIFSADFVILDMEEDKDASLIMGRPFLWTGTTLIDVAGREMIIIVNNEQEDFDIFKAMDYSNQLMIILQSKSSNQQSHMSMKEVKPS